MSDILETGRKSNVIDAMNNLDFSKLIKGQQMSQQPIVLLGK
jgi:hypothetical protein